METESQIKKIVIIGPESTGKSTLCEQLAAHYNTRWVREYAREYLEKNGAAYAFDDLYKIAEGQLVLEDAGEKAIGNRQRTKDDRQEITDNRQQITDNRQQTADNRLQTSDNGKQITDNSQQTTDNRQQTVDQASKKGAEFKIQRASNLRPSTFNPQPSTFPQDIAHNIQHLFFDTDLRVIKIWSEFVFNKIDNRILTAIGKKKYDLYLLCDVDLPWVKDELREYPDLATRKKLFHYYKEEMIEQDSLWVIISGSYEERLQKAIRAVESLAP